MSGALSPEAVNSFFARLQAQNPEPRTELKYTTPYTLLVAVVLSAQATDRGVNCATEALFQQVRTPQEMLELGTEGLISHIKTIGLYRNKARFIIALSERLVTQYHGEIPSTREALESLPGVGRKTANVVLNCLFGQPTIAVDTHIFRVANRTGLAQGSTPLMVEKGLERVIPAAYLKQAHHWLILLGRYTCTARRPKCFSCPVRSLCLYPHKTKMQKI